MSLYRPGPCARCQLIRPIHARNLCRSCYATHRDEFPLLAKPLRPWTGLDLERFRNYRQSGTKNAVIAQRLGRSVRSIVSAVRRFKMARREPSKGIRQGVQRLHRRGWTDYRISKHLGIKIQSVKDARLDLGLRAHTDYRERYQHLVKNLGQSPVEYHWERSRHAAISDGWPIGCTSICARHLAAVERHGDWMSAEEFAAAVGFKTRRRGQIALWKMERRGWIVSKAVGRKPSGTFKLHMLAPEVVERRRLTRAFVESQAQGVS